MTELFYASNEAPDFADWDGVIMSGSVSQVAAAAFPETGQLGLRFETDPGSSWCGGVYKSVTHDWAAGESIHVGFRFRLHTPPDQYTHPCVSVYNGSGGPVGRFDVDSGGGAILGGLTDDQQISADPAGLTPGFWAWLVLEIRRATGPASSNGALRLYCDGLKIAELDGLDLYDAATLDQLRVGSPFPWDAQPGTGYDVDDVILTAGAYPEPEAAAPEDELPSARRTVLLVPEGPDGREFAEHCAAVADLPRSNCVYCPSASGAETFGSYAEFQAQIEQPLAEMLGRHTAIAEAAACFVCGPGLPGYFQDAGQTWSVPSRLARFGQARQADATNPLHDPQPVGRLGVSELRAAGVYLAARVDGPTLAACKAVVDRAAALTGGGPLSAPDAVWSDDEAWLASLGCGLLRLPTEAFGPGDEIATDALVLRRSAGFAFGAPGSRACILDDSAAPAETLRYAGAIADAVHVAGYTAALGACAGQGAFSAEAFFDTLRAGGSFAEAALVACPALDAAPVPVGWPTLMVPLRRDGWNVYRGEGSPVEIDYAAPAAALPPQTGDKLVRGQVIAPGARVFYGVRRVSPAGVEEQNTHVVVRVDLDAGSSLRPPAPSAPSDVTADAASDGSVVVAWSYAASPGDGEPDTFDVFTDAGTGTLDVETPAASVPARPDRRDYAVTVVCAALPAMIAVRARTAGRHGPLSDIAVVPAVPLPSLHGGTS